MKRICLTALLTVVALTAAGVSAGEAPPAKPPEPKPKQPQKFNEHMLAQLQREAGICGVIVVAKAGQVGEMADDKDRPPLPNENPMWGWGGNQFGMKAQRVRFQVKEVLRGPKGLAELTVMVRHFDFNSARQRLFEADRKGRFKAEDIFKEAAVEPGEEYLLLLAVDENVAPDEGAKESGYSTLRMPLFGPPPEAVKSLRGLAARIQAYGAPPALTDAQRKTAEAGIKALASGDWTERQKAHKQLADLGPAAMALLDETGKKTSDLEVRLRCAAILDEIKPLPGADADDWAGDYVIRKIEKKPAEDEGEEDGDADDDADGDAPAAKAPAKADPAKPGKEAKEKKAKPVPAPAQGAAGAEGGSGK